MRSVFVWNRVNINDFNFSENFAVIEEYFNRYFAPHKIIYSAKARHFFPLILELEGLSRSNLVFTQPYSSHCVLSSVSYQSTPNTSASSFFDASIIYHQYGYKNIVDLNKFKNVIIEDSVDSFFLEKSQKEIFPNNANYSILSLPKLINSPFGAIAICKNDTSYEKLKKLINKKNTRVESSSVYSDLINKSHFTQAILEKYKFITPIISDIDKEFSSCKNIVKNNVELIKNYFNVKSDFSKRLPSNIFLDEKHLIETRFKNYIQEPFRHIVDYKMEICQKKQLIPVHCGIDWSQLI